MALVLIVEDEFAIADLLEMALTDEGYRVVLAANGRQGVERLAEGPLPDLVISDYMMPVLDGAGFLRAMQSSEAQRHIPFIVMSSMPEANVRERISGYIAFVRKPFQLAALVRLVATSLSASTPDS
jgi:CheY-like chemotaxis protein